MGDTLQPQLHPTCAGGSSALLADLDVVSAFSLLADLLTESLNADDLHVLRQLIFLRKSDCLGCAVLLCLVVCLNLLASFFLTSHLSLKHVLYVNIKCTFCFCAQSAET